MNEKRTGLLAFRIFILLLCISFASAIGVTLTAINSTYAQVDVSDAVNLYGYEVNFDYTGTIDSATFSDFMNFDSVGVSNGHSERGSVSSVYESRLDSGKTGVSGSGNLFNVSHTGSLTLNNAVFVYNDSTNGTASYVVVPVIPPTTTSGGGGGGGGSTSKTPAKAENISVDLRYIDMNMAVNSNQEKIIVVTNLGKVNRTIQIIQQSLDDSVLIPESSFTLGAGESRNLKFVFTASSEPGITTGKIFIGGNEILVSISAEKKEMLFDVSVLVLNPDKTVKAGGDLDAQISLIPLADNSRLDTTLNYIIKDFDGKTYLQESETLLIEGPKNLQKRFNTKNFPAGEYILGVEAAYLNSTAVSSSHFRVEKAQGIYIYALIIGGILILAIFLIFIFKRRKATRKSTARGAKEPAIRYSRQK